MYLALRNGDGRLANIPYVWQPLGPGVYQPTPPGSPPYTPVVTVASTTSTIFI